MTSPTSAATNRPARRPAARRGFTLVEIIVVLGIIIVLAGLLLPSINKARLQAARSACASDLSAIGTALEAYRQDHGTYPRIMGPPVTTPATADRYGFDGAVVLCQALISPSGADGAPGLGFRTRPGGKVYGPYIAADRFEVGPVVEQDPPLDETRYVIRDRFGKPVLYFPASTVKPNVTLAGDPPPYVSQSEASRYDLNDNVKAFDATTSVALAKMRVMLGDITAGGNVDYAAPDGVINSAAGDKEVTAPFVLWSAGPDELYGPVTLNELGVRRCDDVTNAR